MLVFLMPTSDCIQKRCVFYTILGHVLVAYYNVLRRISGDTEYVFWEKTYPNSISVRLRVLQRIQMSIRVEVEAGRGNACVSEYALDTC